MFLLDLETMDEHRDSSDKPACERNVPVRKNLNMPKTKPCPTPASKPSSTSADTEDEQAVLRSSSMLSRDSTVTLEERILPTNAELTEATSSLYSDAASQVRLPISQLSDAEVLISGGLTGYPYPENPIQQQGPCTG